MRTTCLVALTCIAIAAAACRNQESAQPKHYVDAKRGIEFDYPADWKVEELPQQNVLLLSSPVLEANWQTNAFLELRSDLDTTATHEQRLATLAELAEREIGFFAAIVESFHARKRPTRRRAGLYPFISRRAAHGARSRLVAR